MLARALTAWFLAVGSLVGAAADGIESDLPVRVVVPAGTGGLPAEHDLAVGRGALAVSNRQAVFVVTAADGVVHRLALPGYHPRLYDDARPGIALSPEGDRLAYAWHGPMPPRTMPAGKYVRHRIASTTRVVDLRTGRISPSEELPASGGRVHGFIRWDPRWSPDGRFVVSRWTLVEGKFSPGWQGCCSSGNEALHTGSWQAFGGPTGATMDYEDGSALVRRGIVEGFDTWSAGRFSADGRWLMLQPRSPGKPLRLLDREAAPASATVYADVDPAAQLRLQGWVGERHLLAVLRGAAATDMLVLGLRQQDLDQDAEQLEASTQVVGRIVGLGPDDVVSLAPGLVRAPGVRAEEGIRWPLAVSVALSGLTVVVLGAGVVQARRVRSNLTPWERRTTRS